MKICFKDKIIDGDKQPIAIILTNQDKDLINRMSPYDHMYCCYPKTAWTEEQIKKWMTDVRKES
jgi:hypothetical protein